MVPSVIPGVSGKTGPDVPEGEEMRNSLTGRADDVRHGRFTSPT